MQSSQGDLLVITIYDERKEKTSIYGGDAAEFCK